jgi:alanyl-tRNA synthetase
MEKAKSMGAMALFGEKYGDHVRVVEFGKSIELCGGTHVEATGSIGIVKIVSEGAIAAGIRRIEAVTALKAEEYINDRFKTIDEIASLLKCPGSITDSVEKLLAENSSLKKSVEKFQFQSITLRLKELVDKAVKINSIRFVSGQIETVSPDVLKNIAYQLRTSSENTVMVIGSENSGKANILVTVSDDLVKGRKINAVAIIKEISGEINGGGGGQPFLATAGGKNPEGIQRAIEKAVEFLQKS